MNDLLPYGLGCCFNETSPEVSGTKLQSVNFKHIRLSESIECDQIFWSRPQILKKKKKKKKLSYLSSGLPFFNIFCAMIKAGY